MGQEEALVQLDKSIDDWITKLEQVDNRRTRVRQMLLEHIAASLILSTSYDSQTTNQQDIVAIQSPVDVDVGPLDIELDLDEMASVARESIKIYADYGLYGEDDMANLLADIEQQMETMSDSRRPTSFARYNLVI